MTRKQAIKEFRREGMIIPQNAVELAISDMEKIESIEQIVNSETDPNICNNVGDVRKVQAIKKILEKE